jgi:hypothetical protein
MGEVKAKKVLPHLSGGASLNADISPVPGEGILHVTNPTLPTYTEMTLDLSNGIPIP